MNLTVPVFLIRYNVTKGQMILNAIQKKKSKGKKETSQTFTTCLQATAELKCQSAPVVGNASPWTLLCFRIIKYIIIRIFCLDLSVTLNTHTFSPLTLVLPSQGPCGPQQALSWETCGFYANLLPHVWAMLTSVRLDVSANTAPVNDALRDAGLWHNLTREDFLSSRLLRRMCTGGDMHTAREVQSSNQAATVPL